MSEHNAFENMSGRPINEAEFKRLMGLATSPYEKYVIRVIGRQREQITDIEAEVERLKKYKALADEAVPMISKLAGPHRVEWLANYTALKETT